jgi:hypothetical protein
MLPQRSSRKCVRAVHSEPLTSNDDSNYRQMADRVVTVGYAQPGWERPFPFRDKEVVET